VRGRLARNGVWVQFARRPSSSGDRVRRNNQSFRLLTKQTQLGRTIMKAGLMATLASALALSRPAIAQSSGNASNQDRAQQSQSSGQQTTQSSDGKNQRQNVITINKLKQDLEDAGFSDVKILANSYVVQAKDKKGNPTIMSLSPSGVVAFSVLNQQRQAKAKTSSSSSDTQRR
jgi:hypothetical protein